MSDKKEDKVVSGRPLKYKTPQELQDAIDLFISDCPDKRKLVYEGNIIEVPCPTISGLAYYLSMIPFLNH